MKKIRKIISLTLMLSLISLVSGIVLAADIGEVSCTVTGKLISLTVSDGAIAYGVVAISTTQDTTASGVVDTQTANNNGTISENFKIKSTDATRDGGIDWTLDDTASPDKYTHKASLDAGSTWDIAMTEAGIYVTLSTDIAVDADETFDLEIGMPTSITDYLEHSITITVMAEEHP